MNLVQKIVVSVTAMSFFIFSGVSQAAIADSDLTAGLTDVTSTAQVVAYAILEIVIVVLALTKGVDLLKRLADKI